MKADLSRIQKAFAARKRSFVGYVMAGFPDAEGAFKLATGLLDQGADLLEVAIPFSDPIADGVTIQRCSEIALQQGGSTAMALDLLKRLRAATDKPLLVMTYLNPILAMGVEAFARKAAEAGADGAIIPDLTPEESGPLKSAFAAHGMHLVFLAAPTSDRVRLKRIAAAASGFIYMVSVAGVTGERKSFDPRVRKAVAGLRSLTKVPIVVGFGVSSPETAKEAAGMADGVVAASTILKGLLEGKGMREALVRASSLIQAVHAG